MKFAGSIILVGISIGIAAAQQPTVSQGGVVNSANYSTDNPRGSLVTVFGTNMVSGANELLTASTVPLSTEVIGKSPAGKTDKVSVSVNDTPAPIFYAAGGAEQGGALATQASIQVPWETKTGTADIVVTLNGQASAPQQFHVTTFSPAIFTINQQGTGPALVFNAVAITVNGKATLAIAQPANSVPGLTAIPAKGGDHLFLYATGLGPVTPSIASGAAPCKLTGCVSTDKQRTTTTLPVVLVGGVPAKVEFSGLAPQYVGVYQLNFQVPSGIPASSTTTLQVQAGNVTSNSVTFATQ